MPDYEGQWPWPEERAHLPPPRGSPPSTSSCSSHDDGLEPRRDDPQELCRRFAAAMLRQNRSLQSQYDGMLELRDIDSRRESIQAREYPRFRRRRMRRTRRATDKGQLEENEDEHESPESYEPSSLSRGNDNIHRDLGATKSRHENEARPGQRQPQSSEGEWS